MKVRALICGFLMAAASTVALSGVTSVRTIPANPVAGQDFAIEMEGFTGGSPSFIQDTSASIAGQVITVQVRALAGGFAVAGSFRVSETVKVAAPGTYQLNVVFGYTNSSDTQTLTSSVVVGTAAASAAPQFRALSGLWWAPDEPGWALAVTQGDSGNLFVLWFTYAPTSSIRASATWFMIPTGSWSSPTEFSGLLYTANGPSANTSFTPGDVQIVFAGTARIRVLSADRLEFEADATGNISKRKTLQRFQF